jgi:lipopolysaccharide transport system ATP-binding protein
MSDIVIKVENLSKKYIIRHQQAQQYTALRDVIADGVKSIGRRLTGAKQDPLMGSTQEEFWSLKDVSFEIKQGEVVGFIGRNGAGKSTLLKILSRITEPTSGEAMIKGRVSSLLEVGTGFHPELTGRENIFLNGAILGMSKVEIKKKFDEIVDFAEVEKFLDTPVKHYSSGMFVRLAFAVAAHLEPEILIVDEVLAVGDAQFQKKCLGKIGDIATKEGRTVLFVSHSMSVIAQLCGKAFLLSSGSVVKEGNTNHVIDRYLSELSATVQDNFVANPNPNLNKNIFIAKAQTFDKKGIQKSHFAHEETVIVTIDSKINCWIPHTVMGFFVRDQRGRKVFTAKNPKWHLNPEDINVQSTAVIPSNFLVPGQYFFTFAISIPNVKTIDLVEDALKISIIDTGSVFASYEGYDYGCVFAECKWS